MLTDAEKHACRTATFTEGRRAFGYGSLDKGLCPVGCVAAMRGVVFDVPLGASYYTAPCNDDPGSPPDALIVSQAMQDVMVYAGFTDWGDYLDALEAHGTAIFPLEEPVAV